VSPGDLDAVDAVSPGDLDVVDAVKSEPTLLGPESVEDMEDGAADAPEGGV
jgi:hypothetical protein